MATQIAIAYSSYIPSVKPLGIGTGIGTGTGGVNA